MRIWVPETIKILINLWGDHTTAEITDAINAWIEHNARIKGWAMCPRTTEPGVMYQAYKVGLVTRRQAERFHREFRKLMARQHYVNADLREAVLERDGRKCLLCGATEDLEMDHIIPLTMKGKTEIENLQTLCRRCHRTEKGGTMVDFRKPYVKDHCPHCHRTHYRNVPGTPWGAATQWMSGALEPHFSSNLNGRLRDLPD